MRIQELMSKRVVSVTPATTIAEATERLRASEIDHLVVVEEKRVVGVVAGKDLLRLGGDGPISEVMNREVVTIEPDATLRRAAGIMRGRDVGCLPVVEDGHLVGIVTTSDLLTAVAKGTMHTPPPDGRVVLRKRGPRKLGVPIGRAHTQR